MSQPRQPFLHDLVINAGRTHPGAQRSSPDRSGSTARPWAPRACCTPTFGCSVPCSSPSTASPRAHRDPAGAGHRGGRRRRLQLRAAPAGGRPARPARSAASAGPRTPGRAGPGERGPDRDIGVPPCRLAAAGGDAGVRPGPDRGDQGRRRAAHRSSFRPPTSRGGPAGPRISSRSICRPSGPRWRSAPTAASWSWAGPSRFRPAAAPGSSGPSTSLTRAASCSPPRRRRWTPWRWPGTWPRGRPTRPGRGLPAPRLAGTLAGGPQRPADGHPVPTRRHLLRRRVTLVPDPVRPRLALGRPDAAAGRPGVRAGHAAGAGRPGRHHRGREHRRGPRQDPARTAARRPSRWGTSRCRRCTTAPSTPPRCGSACCTTRGAPGCPTEEVAALLPTLEARAALGGRVRRRRRRRLPGVPRRQRARAGQPGLEGLRRRGPVRRRHDRRGSGRAVRGAGRTRTRRRSNGADLLDCFGRPAASGYRDLGRRSWPTGSGRRSGAAPVTTASRPWPSTATKRPVDSLTSNIGHLLGTGLLDRRRGAGSSPGTWPGPTWTPGWGLRTMSAADGGYSPLSYHCGSVWPHDTAIAILGLHRAGLRRTPAG